MKRTALLAAVSTAAFANAAKPATTPAVPGSDATTAAAKADRVTPEFTAVGSALTMPVKTSKRGSASIYPFASLTAVGMSFGVKNKDAKSLSSVISNANRKAVVDRKDDAGNIVYKTTEIKDANGAVVGRTPTTEPETDVTAHYFAVDVDAAMTAQIKGTPLEGSKAVVFRDK